MKKIELSEKENFKYETIKKLVEEGSCKKSAALKIGCSIRQVDRMINGYNKLGKIFFRHKNRGKTPSVALDISENEKIIKFYKEEYFDFNFYHFYEKIKERGLITCCYSTVKKVLLNANILSPKSHKKTKKIIKDRTNGKENFDSKLQPRNEAHPRRERMKNFGELIQMDASNELWFGNEKSQLHLAIDDATGKLVGGYFDKQETLNGYYQVVSQILENYGIPAKFFTDRRTVFEYKKLEDKSSEENNPTQFAYACSKLGIEIVTSSVPQAKGRIERVFGTLQSRLICEMREAKIKDMESANKFLQEYIQKFNEKFSVEHNPEYNIFGNKLPKEEINFYLSVHQERKIDKGNSIKFLKNYYIPIDKNGEYITYKPGTKVSILKTLDGNLLCNEGKNIYNLKKIETHKKVSKDFDLNGNEPKEKIEYIPPQNISWRSGDYEKYAKKEEWKLNEFR